MKIRSLSLPLVLALAAGCARLTPEEKAFQACRAEVARHLVDPTSATYARVSVVRRSGDGRDVVDGWDVDVRVTAAKGNGKTATSTVRCTEGVKFELLDLSGQEDAPES